MHYTFEILSRSIIFVKLQILDDLFSFSFTENISDRFRYSAAAYEKELASGSHVRSSSVYAGSFEINNPWFLLFVDNYVLVCLAEFSVV